MPDDPRFIPDEDPRFVPDTSTTPTPVINAATAKQQQMPNAEEMLKSGLGGAFNFLTTSAIPEPTEEEWMSHPYLSPLKWGASQLTTPLGVLTSGAAGAGLYKGLGKLGVIGKGAAEAAPEIKMGKEVGEDLVGAQSIKNQVEEIGTGAIKPKMSTIPGQPGKFLNKETGEVIDVANEMNKPFLPDQKPSIQFNPKGQKGLTGTAQEAVKIKNPTINQIREQGELGNRISKVNEGGEIEFKPYELPLVDKPKSKVADVLNIPRTLLASQDLSAPLRQGLPLIHRKEWWTSWDDMVKSWGSENSFRATMEGIEAHPDFKYSQQVGLKLTDLVNEREEQFASTIAEKIPGVRRSTRAYTAFLDKLRSDTFYSLVQQARAAGLDPDKDLVLGKGIANFVNNATGRGSLGKLEKNADLFNAVFFSPRLIASRVQMMNPVNYIRADPFVRKQYLKSMAATTGAWTTFAGLAKAGGAKVSLDPDNADFGKIRIGNARLDPAAGFQQYLVLMSRLATGQYTSSTSSSGRRQDFGSVYGGPTKLSAITDFASNKFNPLLKFGYDMLGATKYRPFNVEDRVAQMFIPMVIQDAIELGKEADPATAAVFVPLAGMGMGTQSYSGRPENLIFGKGGLLGGQ